MPRPFRGVTLLFSAGENDKLCPKAATAAHPLSQTTGSSRAKAPGQRLASGDASPGLKQPLQLDVHLGYKHYTVHSPLRAHSRMQLQSRCSYEERKSV
ncbi:hypothetical protein EXN66_Car013650 [Channa argus]|uniref:Uncharacterized protein n=1 Tax=Channa argus TaxID=215402 RepID=A0A6G1Q6B5_CHAAH|nr:hypothetical protein EXN66_Car013650 [Channa argus]